MSFPRRSFITRKRGFRLVLLAATCFSAIVSAAPKVASTIVVPLRLPWSYMPAALPKAPIDKELQVGILLPAFHPERSARWTVPVMWIGNASSAAAVPRENVVGVDLIIVNAVAPVAGSLPKVFRRLYPKAVVLTTRDCATCDLIVVITVDTKEEQNAAREIRGLRVTISATVFARDGTIVASLSGNGMSLKNPYSSGQALARQMGDPALREAIDDLFTQFVNHASLIAVTRERLAERSRPAELETAVTFDDAGSFLPNGRLDAGEGARLHFTIHNHGAGAAFGVRLRIPRTASVAVPAETEVGDIPVGGTKEVDVPITAGIDIESAQQQLRVETVEKRGYGGRTIVVQFVTEQLKRPTLEIADIRLDDRRARARGDGDGRPANGETLEVVILIRNSGPGEAVGAVVTVSSKSSVEVMEPSMAVSTIPVNAVKEARILLNVPVAFSESDLGLHVRAVETRGTAVAMAEKEQRWPFQVRRPQIEIGVRLFDGNSPHSHGNRDGVANNGEKIEVAIVPSNRGSLAARAVRLMLAASVAGVVVEPKEIDIGELPPLSEGAEQRVRLAIARAVGRDELLQRLPLRVTIVQADFPPDERSIGLVFAGRRPDLVANVTSQSPVVEGKTTLLSLDVQNRGPLSAEDVRVNISSDHPAIEILDAIGKPVRAIVFDLGQIQAGVAAAKRPFRIHVRRNAVAAPTPLKVVVSQRDFAAVAAQSSLDILKEDATLFSAPLPPAREVAPPRVAGIPATVSFQRYRDGSLLSEEAIFLSFEVHSQAPLQTVRLEQNHRPVDLPESMALRSGGPYLWQYETRVSLEYGANEFEVVTVTTDGVRHARTLTLHREQPRGRVWLAVVGISSYRDPLLADLDFAKEDAVSVRSYYQELGIPREQVIELLDEGATLANIKRSLGTELVKRADNPDDMVVIYFAGHGQMEPDRSSADADGFSKYLLPHDATPADLFGSGLSMEELSRILQRLRPERVVLIIDSCFSGAAGGRTPFEPNAASRSVVSEEFLARMANAGKGRVILTASGSREVARESRETRHGIFTYFLLEGLRGAADADRDGRVDVDEIYKYVSQKVSSATHGRQNPMRKSPNLSGTVFLGGRIQ